MDLISSCEGNRIIDVGAGATTLIDSMVDNIVPFKRKVYATILEEFNDILKNY